MVASQKFKSSNGYILPRAPAALRLDPPPGEVSGAMRRTTLGGLTSSQLNARPSMGGSRLAALGEGGGKALPPPAPRLERSLGELGGAGAPAARGSLPLQRRTSVYSGSGSGLRQVRGARAACRASAAASDAGSAHAGSRSARATRRNARPQRLGRGACAMPRAWAHALLPN